jgi:hypothetical protein
MFSIFRYSVRSSEFSSFNIKRDLQGCSGVKLAGSKSRRGEDPHTADAHTEHRTSALHGFTASHRKNPRKYAMHANS